MLTLWEMPKRTKGMFNGKYTSIFDDGRYLANLGKR
jgi:hypothetical protein